MKKKLNEEETKVFEDTVKRYHKATKSVVLKAFKKDIDYNEEEAFEAIQKALANDVIEEDGKWLVWCGD